MTLAMVFPASHFSGKSGLNLPFPKMNGKYLFRVNNKNATIMSAGTVLVSPLLRD